jgi:branched-chain amino acid transport system ATP-binding protein
MLMSDVVLSLHGIRKSFGGVIALDAVSLDVHRGEILALVGPNGAGKSVLVNLISGFYAVTAGRIILGDRDITQAAVHQRSRLGIARTFQNIRIFKRMSVLENVLVAVKDHAQRPLLSFFSRASTSHTDHAMQLLDRLGLSAKANDLAGSLAYGEARRLEIARAMTTQPQIMLLDEPAAGMNDRETEDLSMHIQALRQDVPAIVVIEHDMGFLGRLCDRMVVLDYGRKIAEGSAQEVFQNPHVIQAYLGADV